jgi:hypothetical protein
MKFAGKANHLCACARPPRVAIRACTATTKPRVAATMHKPVLKHHSPGGVSVNRPRIRLTVQRLATFNRSLSTVTALTMRRHRNYIDDVASMDGLVAVAVKHDGGYRV